MTAATIETAAPDSLGRLWRAVQVELLKLRTTRMWWGLLIGAVGAVVLITTLFTLAYSASDDADLRSPEVLRSVYGFAFSIGQLFVLILGVIAMAGEYRHKTITGTFLTTPRRGLVVVAKMLALFVAGLAYGVVLVVADVAAAATVLATRGYGAGLGAEGVGRTLLVSVLGLGLYGILGVGFATLVRNQIAAIIVVLALQFIVEPIVSGLAQLNDTTADIAQFLPGSAAGALISGYSGGQDVHMLPWWGGGLVLLTYAVVLAVIGWALTTRRDIS
jgi:ABC-type transport system involved in multi-copper enzyme maturation permease subunit